MPLSPSYKELAIGDSSSLLVTLKHFVFLKAYALSVLFKNIQVVDHSTSKTRYFFQEVTIDGS